MILQIPTKRKEPEWPPFFRLVAPLFVAFLLFSSTSTHAQNSCMLNSEITVLNTSLGSPLSGPFLPDETITIALNVYWSSFSCNWLHGVIPTFGNGWSPASFGPTGEPLDVLESLNKGNGNFFWYDDSSIYYNFNGSNEYAPGEAMEPGWFISATTGIPNSNCAPNDHIYNSNCSCGIPQGCNSDFLHTMILQLKTTNQDACLNGANDLTVNFKIFSDAETGSAPGVGCLDMPAVTKNWVLDCATNGPALMAGEMDISSNAQLSLDLKEYLVDPAEEGVIFQWSAESNAYISGAADCMMNCGSVIEHNLVNNSTVNAFGYVQYTVTAYNSDGEAGLPAVFLVKVQPTLEVEISIPPGNICPEDCIQLVASAKGGSGNYEYVWDAGSGESLDVCPTETSTYSVTVTDDLGATATAEVEVSVDPLPEAIVDFAQVVPCAGLVPSFLTFITSVPSYSFTWAGPGINLNNIDADTVWLTAPGIYHLELMDNNTGCVNTFEKMVVELLPEVLTLGTTITDICWGNSPMDILRAEPEGGVWTGNVDDQGYFIPSTIGEQVLVYTYENPYTACVVEGELILEVEDAELPVPILNTTILPEYCVGFIYEFCVDAIPDASYAWKIENGTIDQTNAIGNCVEVRWNDTQVLPSLCVDYQDAAGCLSKQICADGINLVDENVCSVGTKDLELLDFSIFPNPVRDQINIIAEQPFSAVQIYNAFGQLILEKNLIISNEGILSTINLSSGVYFMALDRKNLTKFVVVR